jgi:hypothetical protein
VRRPDTFLRPSDGGGGWGPWDSDVDEVAGRAGRHASQASYWQWHGELRAGRRRAHGARGGVRRGVRADQQELSREYGGMGRGMEESGDGASLPLPGKESWRDKSSLVPAAASWQAEMLLCVSL